MNTTWSLGRVCALAYTGPGIVLTHAVEPARMLLDTAIVAAAMSLMARRRTRSARKTRWTVARWTQW